MQKARSPSNRAGGPVRPHRLPPLLRAGVPFNEGEGDRHTGYLLTGEADRCSVGCLPGIQGCLSVHIPLHAQPVKAVTHRLDSCPTLPLASTALRVGRMQALEVRAFQPAAPSAEQGHRGLAFASWLLLLHHRYFLPLVPSEQQSLPK